MQSCHILLPEDPEVEKPEEEVEDPIIDTLPEEEALDTFDILFPEKYPDTIKITYLLPLFFEKDSLTGSQRQLRNISQRFYQGSRIALDTLKACGYHIEINVLDSENDTIKLEKLKGKIQEISPHLMIGPLFRQNVKFLSDFIAEEQINTVAPVANIEECPLDNPYIFFSNPSVKRYGEAAAEIANEQFAPVTPVIIRRDNEDEARIADYFVENLDFLIMDSLREVVFRRDQWQDEPIDEEIFGEANFVFIPSRHEPFVTNMFTYLQMAGKNYVVTGLDRWQEFSRIDGVLWKRFRVHMLGSYFIDYEKVESDAFIRMYRNAYNTEPEEFAFRGFDETLAYANLIATEGVYFQRSFFPNPVMEDIRGLHKSYRYKDEDYCGSWINQYIHKLKFGDDYRLQKMD